MLYPDYIHQLLIRARDEGQWYAAQADAAALCFDALAFFPNCAEASELAYELFCDEWTIYDNRVALQQHIDEWDDRPWQQRRRQALSFRFMSRWEGWHINVNPYEVDDSAEVTSVLHEGKMELLGAYCLGDEECTDYAWAIFSDALNRSHNRRAVLLWIGKTYADLGFFADAAEALGELYSSFDDPDTRRSLVEVLWWRDNAHRLPWLPPAGDGSRYDRMMQFIDPSAPKAWETVRRIRAEHQRERREAYRPAISPQLSGLFSLPAFPPDPVPTLVDWSFLDRDDGQPGEPADWAKKQARLFRGKIGKQILLERRWTRNIPPPSTPKRRNPNEAPFTSEL
jgi:hypothetical protein